MRTLIILLSICFICFSAENNYTFVGKFSYLEILNALSTKTGRSVLGSSECLDLVREWVVQERPFTVAVDHVRKNLYSDGYYLRYDTTYFYVDKIVPDTPAVVVPPVQRKVYLPYSKKWLVTNDLQSYLNAIPLDSIQYMADSLKRVNNVYRYSLLVLGTTYTKDFNASIYFDEMLKINFNISPPRYPDISLGLNAALHETNSEYNFFRQIVFYSGDSLRTFHFGTEFRRTSGKMQSQNILSETYESVFDGLTIETKGSGVFSLNYRIDNASIELSGVPDSIIYGSAIISEQKKRKSLLFIPSRNNSSNQFSIIARLTCQKM